MAAAEIRPDWTIGTLNLTSGSVEFTTNDSMLQTAAIQPGDEIITASGLVLIIASITGQNSGTLMEPCPADAAGSGQPLRIRFQPDGSRYNGATAELVQLLGSGNVYEFAGLQGVANGVPVFTGAGTMEIQGKDTFVTPDPNGNLAELSGLSNVDNLAELAGLALAGNKVLTTDDNGELTQSDITAAARVLLKLAGSAAANQLPYFTGANEAGLTPLTAFARSILDDASGEDVWSTLGGIASSSIIKFPSGIILQRGKITLPSRGYGTFAFPTAFPTACFGMIACPAEDAGASYTYTITTTVIDQASYYGTGHTVFASDLILAGVTFEWLAWGN